MSCLNSTSVPTITNLISKFESIAQTDTASISNNQRVPVRVKRFDFDMPFRQSTLSFSRPASSATKATTLSMVRLDTPSDGMDSDTIVVKFDNARLPRAPLPTPSESATDLSSGSPQPMELQSPPKSRSTRVSRARKSTSSTTLRAQQSAKSAKPAEEDKQRSVSGETLVGSATISQTSLVKSSIDVLDLTWNMSDVFNKDGKTQEENEADSDIIVVNTGSPDEEDEDDEEDEAARRVEQAAKKAKMEDNKKKWEQRKKEAEKNATRRSGRASILTKATEVVSDIASTVLGKRTRDQDKNKDQSQPESEDKKARLSPEPTMASKARSMRSRAPRDKKWLTAGLYAGQPRTFDPTKTEAKNKRKSTTTPADSSKVGPKENYILPLPMFAGQRLLENGRDFKLPFDIFSPLPAGQPKPDEWRKVNKNVFIGDAQDEWRHNKFTEYSTCMCKPDTGCDEDCMNRCMYYECDEKNCTLTAEQCGNRGFEELRQRREKGGKYNVGVEVIKTADRGYGVRSNRTFESNQIIVEYTGEIINQEECERRMHTMYKDNECYYLMAFDQNMIIDATRGSIARFVNHSCEPNCRMEKWTVGGKPRMALFAGERGVMTGEELTYDYNFDPYSQKNVQVCRCGAANCRGVLGPKPKRPSNMQVEGEGKAKKEKEGKIAGAKRKLVDVLEEGTNLLNKKRKINDKKSKALEDDDQENDDAQSGKLARNPSKLKRIISTTSKRSMTTTTKRTSSLTKSVSSTKSKTRVVSASSAASTKGLVRANSAPSAKAGTGLKAKAASLRKNVARSVRGR